LVFGAAALVMLNFGVPLLDHSMMDAVPALERFFP
jgi:hypothetical protein